MGGYRVPRAEESSGNREPRKAGRAAIESADDDDYGVPREDGTILLAGGDMGVDRKRVFICSGTGDHDGSRISIYFNLLQRSVITPNLGQRVSSNPYMQNPFISLPYSKPCIPSSIHRRNPTRPESQAAHIITSAQHTHALEKSSTQHHPSLSAHHP